MTVVSEWKCHELGGLEQFSIANNLTLGLLSPKIQKASKKTWIDEPCSFLAFFASFQDSSGKARKNRLSIGMMWCCYNTKYGFIYNLFFQLADKTKGKFLER